MQTYPELMYLPMHALAMACGMSAVLSMTMGHLPPNSRMQGVRFYAAVYAMILPTLVEPVKQIRSSGSLLTATATSRGPMQHLMASLSI